VAGSVPVLVRLKSNVLVLPPTAMLPKLLVVAGVRVKYAYGPVGLGDGDGDGLGDGDAVGVGELETSGLGELSGTGEAASIKGAAQFMVALSQALKPRAANAPRLA
jgi:hypothetical protein